MLGRTLNGSFCPSKWKQFYCDKEIKCIAKCNNEYHPVKKKSLYVISHKKFVELKNEKVQNNDEIEYLNIDSCGDIQPFLFYDSDTFRNVHTLYVSKCDKNFVFYWCDVIKFPNLSNF